MKRIAFAAVLFTGCAGAPVAPNQPQMYYVAVPVADVRAKPAPHIGMYVQDPDQETQVIQGEPVIVKERQGKWSRVECPHQPEFTHSNAWEGYPGWIESRFLTPNKSAEIGIVADPRPVDDLRRDLLGHAARHLGSPYLWGGRSVHTPDYKRTVTGVDCSGLVNWSFRQIGRIVPRDAHEQFMRARRVEPSALNPGDLIFLSRADKPERVTHVMFFAGDGEIIEAPQSGEAVRRIAVTERLGAGLENLSNGQTVGERVIYFGTLFEEQ